jgi:hypothetical protein
MAGRLDQELRLQPGGKGLSSQGMNIETFQPFFD